MTEFETRLLEVLTRIATRLGKQELLAEVLDDNPGALWNRKIIDSARVKDYPDLLRIVIAVDPAVSSNPDSDDVGIGAAGLGSDGEVYVLADDTMSGPTPNEWGAQVVKTFDTTLDESHDILIDVLACVGGNEADAEP